MLLLLLARSVGGGRDLTRPAGDLLVRAGDLLNLGSVEERRCGGVGVLRLVSAIDERRDRIAGSGGRGRLGDGVEAGRGFGGGSGGGGVGLGGEAGNKLLDARV